MGKFGKGVMNSNDQYLLEFASTNSLILTNTLFQHTMAYRSIWIAPEKLNNRKNPVRNQID